MTKIELDMIEHFEKKTDEISAKVSRKLNSFIYISSIVLISALAIIVVNARMIGSVKTEVDIIHSNYVPGSLLWDFSIAIDRELESLYQLDNGNLDTALYIVNKFSEYRKELYRIHMTKTRGGKKIETKLKPLE